MPLLISGAASVVSAMNRAFSDTSPSNAVYANQIAEAGTTAASQAAWAVSFGSKFTGTSAQLADLLLTNTGIKAAGGTALATAVAAIIDIVGVKNVGQVAMLLSNALSTLEADATYGTAAKAWNAEVTAAYEYSANTANTTASSASAVTGNEASSSYVLLPTPEVKNGTAGNDFFRGVAGVQIGGQDQTTLNSSDVLDGLAGADTLIVNMTGALYSGGARIKYIETLQIGTNLTTGATFDYNVNAGFNEISEVTKVVADQINVGETLTVQNVVRTINADASKTMPTLAWVNDDNSRDAGTVNYSYRAAELTGTTDNQQVQLTSVTNGVMNLSTGMETISITSMGTQRVTLNNSTGNTADVVSGGLKTVNLAGTAEIGKKADVQAVTGLTNRVVAVDTGIDAAATASNLLSVAASTTKIDATTAEAAVNVRFTNGGVSSNNTFIGGAGGDYSEYELGNINASGGAGDDTFAFITAVAATPNSSFGESDTIDGGAGADTIQIGLNGNGPVAPQFTYTISESELRNKSSIGTIDLRGNNTSLTLSSDFVSKADTADTINVLTNKIVQTSATSAANEGMTAYATEDASTHTVNLTMLTANQTVNYVGGSGSDRIILSDATFNVLKNIDGGNYTVGSNAGVNSSNFALGQQRYDTITVVTNGERVVIDSNDLSNVKDIEGFILTKNSTQAVYDITLTAAFLNANTESVNNATNTGIDDRFFQIGTTAAANAQALQAGDTVNIDVTGILAVSGRFVDLTSLVASGATVNLITNGVSALYAQNGATVPGVGTAVVTGADAAAARADVIGSPAIPGVVVPNVLTATGAGFNTTSGFLLTGNQFSLNMATIGNDTVITTEANLLGSTVNLAGGAADALNVTDAITATPNLAINAAVGLEVLNLQGGTTVGGGLNVNNAGITTITLGATGFVTQIAATGITMTGSAAADTLVGGAGNDIITGGDGNNVLSGLGGTDTITTSGTGTGVVDGGAAADTITIGSTGASTVTGGAGIDTITITANTGVSTINMVGTAVAADRDTVTGFSATNDIVRLDIAATTAGTLTTLNAIVQSIVVQPVAAVVFNTALSDVLTLNFDMGGAIQVLGNDLTGSALLANLGGTLAVTADTNTGYIVAYDAGNAYLYSVVEGADAGNVFVDAADIALIGTFTGVAVGALSAANLVMI